MSSPLLLAPEFDGRRPSPVPAPPASGEIRKLRDRLLKWSVGNDDGSPLTEQACELLATAVANPPAVRAQLNRPNVRPCAGGHLEVIYAEVPIDVCVPDLVNGRVVGATAWPAADQSSGQTLKLWAPRDLQVHPESSCEVLVRADSVRDAKVVFEDAAARTKQLNSRMNEKIRRDGILDHLFVQVVHVETLDGHRGAALMTRDGSTRCSFAKEIHDASPHDALFDAVRDQEVRRDRWRDMHRLYRLPIDSIDEQTLVQLRTYLVPVQVVIGFHSDESAVNVLDAVDDVVRRTHVETSWPWLPLAQANSQADQILQALKAHELISHDELLLYGGALARSERVTRDMPADPDRVLADLLLVLGATESRTGTESVHQVIRRATGAGRITSYFKAQVAGSLGLRQFQADGRARQVASATLSEALRVEALWERDWENTIRGPAELLDAALLEFDETGVAGRASLELAVKGVGYLAAQGWLKRQVSGRSDGLERDQRASNVILELLLESRHGMVILAEAMEAGRRGQQARALDPEGEPIELVSGDSQALTNEWLRQVFNEATAGASASTPHDPLPIAQTPREEAAARIRSIEALASRLWTALTEADGVKDDNGEPLLEQTGWSRAQMTPLADQLRDIATRLDVWGAMSERHSMPAASETADEQLGLGPPTALA